MRFFATRAVEPDNSLAAPAPDIFFQAALAPHFFSSNQIRLRLQGQKHAAPSGSGSPALVTTLFFIVPSLSGDSLLEGVLLGAEVHHELGDLELKAADQFVVDSGLHLHLGLKNLDR